MVFGARILLPFIMNFNRPKLWTMYYTEPRWYHFESNAFELQFNNYLRIPRHFFYRLLEIFQNCLD